MIIEQAREKAAQAWCKASTSNIEMNVELAEAFAEILVAEVEELRAENETLKSDLAAGSTFRAAVIAASEKLLGGVG